VFFFFFFGVDETTVAAEALRTTAMNRQPPRTGPWARGSIRWGLLKMDFPRPCIAGPYRSPVPRKTPVKMKVGQGRWKGSTSTSGVAPLDDPRVYRNLPGGSRGTKGVFQFRERAARVDLLGGTKKTSRDRPRFRGTWAALKKNGSIARGALDTTGWSRVSSSAKKRNGHSVWARILNLGTEP